MPKILILPGSARRASYNRKLAAIAAGIARDLGAEVELIDPIDFPLPLFDQELEESGGLPGPAKALKARFIAANAILFVSPEYNSSITPLMKNYIDWISRTESADEPPLAAFSGKVAALLSASPGALGGLRSLVHLRSILGNLGMLVAPGQFALGSAGDQFTDTGDLKNPAALKSVHGVVSKLVEMTAKIHA
ncbi:MAG: putative flavoprotein [Akkermansiaceae bacterium]|nr:putative flavoprotein [Akkermansiaceae bacterium]